MDNKVYLDSIKHPVFPGQQIGERVIFLARRHWSIFLKIVLRLLGAHILPVIIFIFLFNFLEWDIPTDGPLYVLFIMLISCYYLGAWLFYLYQFIDYHLDIWILTDRRIVNIEQNGLFRRTVSELNLIKVQDVTAEERGKVQTFLNFGNVYIQTAAESQRFVFEEVSRPQEVARTIVHAVEHNTLHHNANSHPLTNAAHV